MATKIICPNKNEAAWLDLVADLDSDEARAYVAYFRFNAGEKSPRIPTPEEAAKVLNLGARSTQGASNAVQEQSTGAVGAQPGGAKGVGREEQGSGVGQGEQGKEAAGTREAQEEKVTPETTTAKTSASVQAAKDKANRNRVGGVTFSLTSEDQSVTLSAADMRRVSRRVGLYLFAKPRLDGESDEDFKKRLVSTLSDRGVTVEELRAWQKNATAAPAAPVASPEDERLEEGDEDATSAQEDNMLEEIDSEARFEGDFAQYRELHDLFTDMFGSLGGDQILDRVMYALAPSQAKVKPTARILRSEEQYTDSYITEENVEQFLNLLSLPKSETFRRALLGIGEAMSQMTLNEFRQIARFYESRIKLSTFSRDVYKDKDGNIVKTFRPTNAISYEKVYGRTAETALRTWLKKNSTGEGKSPTTALKKLADILVAKDSTKTTERFPDENIKNFLVDVAGLPAAYVDGMLKDQTKYKIGNESMTPAELFRTRMAHVFHGRFTYDKQAGKPVGTHVTKGNFPANVELAKAMVLQKEDQVTTKMLENLATKIINDLFQGRNQNGTYVEGWIGTATRFIKNSARSGSLSVLPDGKRQSAYMYRTAFHDGILDYKSQSGKREYPGDTKADASNRARMLDDSTFIRFDGLSDDVLGNHINATEMELDTLWDIARDFFNENKDRMFIWALTGDKRNIIGLEIPKPIDPATKQPFTSFDAATEEAYRLIEPVYSGSYEAWQKKKGLVDANKRGASIMSGGKKFAITEAGFPDGMVDVLYVKAPDSKTVKGKPAGDGQDVVTPAGLNAFLDASGRMPDEQQSIKLSATGLVDDEVILTKGNMVALSDDVAGHGDDFFTELRDWLKANNMLDRKIHIINNESTKRVPSAWGKPLEIRDAEGNFTKVTAGDLHQVPLSLYREQANLQSDPTVHKVNLAQQLVSDLVRLPGAEKVLGALEEFYAKQAERVGAMFKNQFAPDHIKSEEAMREYLANQASALVEPPSFIKSAAIRREQGKEIPDFRAEDVKSSAIRVANGRYRMPEAYDVRDRLSDDMVQIRRWLDAGVATNYPLQSSALQRLTASMIRKTFKARAMGIRAQAISMSGSEYVTDYQVVEEGKKVKLPLILANPKYQGKNKPRFTATETFSTEAEKQRILQKIVNEANAGSSYVDLMSAEAVEQWRQNPASFKFKLTDLNLWELDITDKSVTIPGQIIMVSRTPGTGYNSHIMGRLSVEPGGKFSTFIGVHHRLVLAAGVDFDGDKWDLLTLDVDGNNVLRLDGLTNALMLAWRDGYQKSPAWVLNDAIDTDRFNDMIAKTRDEMTTKLKEAKISDPKARKLASRLTRDARDALGILVSTGGVMQYVASLYQTGLDFSETEMEGPKFPRKIATVTLPSTKEEYTLRLSRKPGSAYSDSDQLIRDVVGVLTNVVVDNAKDPKAFAMGINKETVNFVTALLYYGDPLTAPAGSEEGRKEADKRMEAIIQYLNSEPVRLYARAAAYRKSGKVDKRDRNNSLSNIYSALVAEKALTATGKDSAALAESAGLSVSELAQQIAPAVLRNKSDAIGATFKLVEGDELNDGQLMAAKANKHIFFERVPEGTVEKLRAGKEALIVGPASITYTDKKTNKVNTFRTDLSKMNGKGKFMSLWVRERGAKKGEERLVGYVKTTGGLSTLLKSSDINPELLDGYANIRVLKSLNNALFRLSRAVKLGQNRAPDAYDMLDVSGTLKLLSGKEPGKPVLFGPLDVSNLAGKFQGRKAIGALLVDAVYKDDLLFTSMNEALRDEKGDLATRENYENLLPILNEYLVAQGIRKDGMLEGKELGTFKSFFDALNADLGTLRDEQKDNPFLASLVLGTKLKKRNTYSTPRTFLTDINALTSTDIEELWNGFDSLPADIKKRLAVGAFLSWGLNQSVRTGNYLPYISAEGHKILSDFYNEGMKVVLEDHPASAKEFLESAATARATAFKNKYAASNEFDEERFYEQSDDDFSDDDIKYMRDNVDGNSSYSLASLETEDGDAKPRDSFSLTWGNVVSTEAWVYANERYTNAGDRAQARLWFIEQYQPIVKQILAAATKPEMYDVIGKYMPPVPGRLKSKLYTLVGRVGTYQEDQRGARVEYVTRDSEYPGGYAYRGSDSDALFYAYEKLERESWDSTSVVAVTAEDLLAAAAWVPFGRTGVTAMHANLIAQLNQKNALRYDEIRRIDYYNDYYGTAKNTDRIRKMKDGKFVGLMERDAWVPFDAGDREMVDQFMWAASAHMEGSDAITWGHEIVDQAGNKVPALELLSDFDKRWKASQAYKKLQDAGRTQLSYIPLAEEYRVLYNKTQREHAGYIRRIENYVPHIMGSGFVDARTRTLLDEMERELMKYRRVNSKDTMLTEDDFKIDLSSPRPLPPTANMRAVYLKITEGEPMEEGITILDGMHDILKALESAEQARVLAAGGITGLDPQVYKTIAAIRRLLYATKYKSWTGRAMQRKMTGSYADIFKNTKGKRKPADMNILRLRYNYMNDVLAVGYNRAIIEKFTAAKDEAGRPLVIAIPNTNWKDPADTLRAFKQQSAEALAEYLNVRIDPNADLGEAVNALILKMPIKDYEVMESPFAGIKEFRVMKGDAVRIMKHVIEEPRRLMIGDVDVLDGIMSFAQWSKITSVANSLFFPFSIWESVAAGTGLKKNIMYPQNIKKAISEITDIMVGLKNNDPKWVDFVREMTAAGAQLGFESASDENVGVVARDIEETHRRIRLAMGEKVADGVRNVMELYTGKKLSDVFFGHAFPAFKIYAAHQLLHDVAEQSNAGDIHVPNSMKRRAILQRIIPAINDAYGGQMWQRYLWATPRVRQALNLLMFAPNWTISAWNVAGGGLLTGRLLGNTMNKENLEFVFKTNWPAMIAIVLVAAPAVFQATIFALFGDGDLGDEPLPWQNEVGKKSYIDITPIVRTLPWYDGDPTGKRRYYARFGKQAYEVVDGWLVEPVDQLLRKLSQPAKLVLEQVTGKSPGSDWNLEFAGQGFFGWVAAADKAGEVSFLNSRLGYVAQKFIPMSALSIMKDPETVVAAFIVPTSKGKSQGAAVQELTTIFNTYAREDSWIQLVKNPKAKANLDLLAPAIVDALTRNGYDAEKAVTSAKGAVLGNLYKQFWDALNKEDVARMDSLARSILRVGGTVQGLQQSMKNKAGMYGVAVTPMMTADMAEAFNVEPTSLVKTKKGELPPPSWLK